jgi:serine phosphatase RsbU (regulator of sigma subunit)
MPIGLLAGRGHNQLEVQLAEGDRLFFYTDGCVEAENDRREMFGAERLETALHALPPSATPQDVLVHIERAIEQFRGSRELFDDVTVMAVRVG